MGKLFGTDGIRGKAGESPMTGPLVRSVAQAMAGICARDTTMRKPVVLIGRDTRESGPLFEQALNDGLTAGGCDVRTLGVVPTPAVSFLVKHLGAQAGIVISASHNPFEDNGIKIFGSDGYKLNDNLEAEIEDRVLQGNPAAPSPSEPGHTAQEPSAAQAYVRFCRDTFPKDLSLRGMRIVLDCAHGATFQVAPRVFSDLGAQLDVIHASPDGRNINHQCGSQHTTDLSRHVVNRQADVGLAFDGDGDRLVAVDETGRELSGDHIIGICAEAMQRDEQLPGNRVVVTPMSNFGLMRRFRELGIQALEAAVGDRHVLELMRARGAMLGGEQSGHTIFLRHHTTGDGIVSALQLLAICRRTRKKLSTLASPIRFFPQHLINVNVRRKPPIDQVPAILRAIEESGAALGTEGRVLVRYSGTQAMCRVMVEGPTEAMTESLAQKIASVVSAELG
jgi:phosphoglucosamine mutase